MKSLITFKFIWIIDLYILINYSSLSPKILLVPFSLSTQNGFLFQTLISDRAQEFCVIHVLCNLGQRLKLTKILRKWIVLNVDTTSMHPCYSCLSKKYLRIVVNRRRSSGSQGRCLSSKWRAVSLWGRPPILWDSDSEPLGTSGSHRSPSESTSCPWSICTLAASSLARTAVGKRPEGWVFRLIMLVIIIK